MITDLARTYNPPQNQPIIVKCYWNCSELPVGAGGSEHTLWCYLMSQPNLTLNMAYGKIQAALSACSEFLQASAGSVL